MRLDIPEWLIIIKSGERNRRAPGGFLPLPILPVRLVEKWYRVRDLVQGSGIRVQGSGVESKVLRFLGRGLMISMVHRPSFSVEDSGFRIQVLVLRNQDSGFSVEDSRFRIQDSGFSVEDSGFRI